MLRMQATSNVMKDSNDY